jgi:transposase
MKKQRKHYTPEEKVAILRRHLLDKEPISTLCDELGLQPTVFYRWQKEFFENGAAAFEHQARPNHSAISKNIHLCSSEICGHQSSRSHQGGDHIGWHRDIGSPAVNDEIQWDFVVD